MPKLQPTRIFVASLAPAVTNDDLADHFDAVAPVRRAVVVTDKMTGDSRCFGFVTFMTAADAERARVALDGSELRGRCIVARIAIDTRDDAGDRYESKAR